MTEETIFAAALERRDPADRDAFLAGACGSDTALRGRIDRLLAAHSGAGDFLNQPVVANNPDDHEPTRAFSETPDSEFGVTRTQGEGVALQTDDEALGFLAPPRRTDSLGRLGHYEVLEVLGKGGFGIVFRAFDDVLQRVVAVKVLAPQMAATSPARKRFLREAQSSAKIRHENVVQVHATGEEPLPYLVMEFVPGETLQDRLDRTGPLDAMEVLRIGRQIAEGLAAAHEQGLIHRDIKPANVLIESGAQHRVKLTDFGLARAADDASISQSGVVAGTPMYMAPEQAKGESLDHRADLFSLGSVFYVMCSGRPPFRASGTLAVLKRVCEEQPRPIREVIPEVPEWLCAIVEKLHAKDPAERFQSAKEVAELLADCDAQIKAHGALKDYSRIPGGPPVAAAPRRRIGRKWKWAAAALFVLLLGSTAAAWFVPPVSRYVDNRAELAFDLSDPDFERATVFSGEEVVADVDLTSSPRIKLAPGQYTLEVRTRGGRDLKWWYYMRHGLQHGKTSEPPAPSDSIAFRLDVVRGELVVFTATLKPLETPEPRPDSGWVQLFNRKDLTGWKTHPDQPGNWEVKDGVLIGSKLQSHLFAERGNYANFHLRAEASINQGGDSGIRFRAPFSLMKGALDWHVFPAGGYEAEFNNYFGAAPSGSVWRVATPPLLFRAPDDSLIRPGDWQTLEVIAIENHILVKIDGKVVADCSDPERLYSTGHVALQCFTPQTVVQFRKIEIKELPPSPPADHALTFDGVDDHVEVPTLKYVGTHPITLEAWVKVPQVPKRVMSIISNDGALALGLNERGQWSAGVRDKPGNFATSHRYIWSAEPCQPGRLTHVAMVLFGTEGRLFVDGHRQTTRAAQRGDHVPATTPFFIGARRLPNDVADYPLLGEVAALRVSKVARYDRDFTPAARFDADELTMALYQFDEVQGDVLKDSSGNNHHGKIVGAKWVTVTPTAGLTTWGTVIDPLGDSKVTEANGRLTMRVPGDGKHDLNPARNLNAPRVLREVEGDFEATVVVCPFPRPEPGTSARPDGTCYLGAGLLVWASDRHLLRFFRTGMTTNRDGEPYVQAEWFKGTSQPPQRASYVADGPLHLRVRRSGSVLNLAHSPDGESWKEMQPITDLPMEAKVQVGVAAVTTQNKEFAPEFEGFTVTPKP